MHPQPGAYSVVISNQDFPPHPEMKIFKLGTMLPVAIQPGADSAVVSTWASNRGLMPWGRQVRPAGGKKWTKP